MPNKSLKILHLTTHLHIGGITSYVLMLGSALIEKHYCVGVLSGGGEMASDFIARQFIVHEMPIRTKSELNPKLLWSLPKIIALVKREKYELLHAHTRVTQVMAGVISRVTKIPVVTTAHGFFKPHLGRRLFGCWGSRVIAISPLVAEDLKKSHAVEESRIRIVLNAIDAAALEKKLAEKDRILLRKKHGIDQDAVVLGSIARLVEDKGHGYLLRAVERLKSKLPGVVLLILGDGREKQNLLTLAQSLGIEDRVKIFPAAKDTTDILSMTDIFVHPATHREGFGLTIAEAMIAKKPVVATDIPAVNTILQDGVNGYLAEPKNVDGLVKKIMLAVEDKARSAAIIVSAYQFAQRLCSLERMVNETQKVYEEAVDEAGRS